MLCRAFPFIEKLEQADSTEAITAAIERMFGTFGFDYFTFQDFPNPKKYAEFVFCKRVPEQWFKLYVEREYTRIDPAFRQCRRSPDAFVWADAPYDAEQEPLTVQFVRRVADFGLDRGLVIPVPRTKGRLGIVWVGGPNAELDALTRSSINFLA